MTQTISDIIKSKVERLNMGPDREPVLCPPDVANFLWNETKQFSNYDDNYDPSRNVMLEAMMGIHVKEDSYKLVDWCKLVYTVMKGHKPKDHIYAGDLDVYLHILVDTKKKVVYHVRNTCSCAPIVDWIVVWDRDEHCDEIHVREIHAKSDYPKSNYPEKLGLKFYRDRKFVIDYVKKHHMTNLGGVYGDIRDKGYIVSLEYYHPDPNDAAMDNYSKKMNELTKHKDSQHLFYFYSAYVNAMSSFRMIEQKIKSGEELFN